MNQLAKMITSALLVQRENWEPNHMNTDYVPTMATEFTKGQVPSCSWQRTIGG